MSETVELRPFPPFLPPQARVIMMGSFPPAQEKRAMGFHYPNFNNDMWRVYGLIFFNDKDYFRKEGEKAFDADKIKSLKQWTWKNFCPRFPFVTILLRQEERLRKFFCHSLKMLRPYRKPARRSPFTVRVAK